MNFVVCKHHYVVDVSVRPRFETHIVFVGWAVPTMLSLRGAEGLETRSDEAISSLPLPLKKGEFEGEFTDSPTGS